MPLKNPSTRSALRIAVPLFSFGSLLAFVIYSQREADRETSHRMMRGTKSTQILEDLRQIDGASDQYVIENNKKGADEVTWASVQFYLKSGTRLDAGTHKDFFGNDFKVNAPDAAPQATAAATTGEVSNVKPPMMIAPGSKSIDGALFRMHEGKLEVPKTTANPPTNQAVRPTAKLAQPKATGAKRVLIGATQAEPVAGSPLETTSQSGLTRKPGSVTEPSPTAPASPALLPAGPTIPAPTAPPLAAPAPNPPRQLISGSKSMIISLPESNPSVASGEPATLPLQPARPGQPAPAKRPEPVTEPPVIMPGSKSALVFVYRPDAPPAKATPPETLTLLPAAPPAAPKPVPPTRLMPGSKSARLWPDTTDLVAPPKLPGPITVPGQTAPSRILPGSKSGTIFIYRPDPPAPVSQKSPAAVRTPPQTAPTPLPAVPGPAAKPAKPAKPASETSARGPVNRPALIGAIQPAPASAVATKPAPVLVPPPALPNSPAASPPHLAQEAPPPMPAKPEELVDPLPVPEIQSPAVQ